MLEGTAVDSSMSSMRLLMQPQETTDLLILDPLHAGGSPLAGVGAGHSGMAPLTLAGGLGILFFISSSKTVSWLMTSAMASVYV